MERSAYLLGRLVSITVACLAGALVVLAAAALGINLGRTVWWLTQDHPFVSVALAAVGVILVGRKL